MNAARSSSSRQTVNVSSNWSTASTKRPAPSTPSTRLAQLAAAGARRAGCTRLRPALAAGQHAARERGEQAGPDHGGLAAARRSDDAEQRRADEPRDELGDEPLAAEEVRRVGGVERGEALERADHRLARRPRRLDAARAPSGAGRRRRPARPPSSAARRGRPRRASATAPTRRAASLRAHWLATSWTRRGTPALAPSSHSAGMSSAASGGRVEGGDRADRRLARAARASSDDARARARPAPRVARRSRATSASRPTLAGRAPATSARRWSASSSDERASAAAPRARWPSDLVDRARGPAPDA